MLKWLKRGLICALGLLVLMVAGAQLLRSMAYRDEERAALALASVPPQAATDHSGYPALALSDFEIPAYAFAQMAAEVRDYTACLAEKTLPCSMRRSLFPLVSRT